MDGCRKEKDPFSVRTGLHPTSHLQPSYFYLLPNQFNPAFSSLGALNSHSHSTATTHVREATCMLHATLGANPRTVILLAPPRLPRPLRRARQNRNRTVVQTVLVQYSAIHLDHLLPRIDTLITFVFAFSSLRPPPGCSPSHRDPPSPSPHPRSSRPSANTISRTQTHSVFHSGLCSP